MAEQNADFGPDENNPHPAPNQLPVPADAGQLQAASAGLAAVPWMQGAEEDEGLNLISFLHSLRRRWLVASALGFLAASVLAAMLWFLIPVSFEAICLMRVRREQQAMLGGQNRGSSNQDYATYKQTHANLLKSPFVVSAALRNEGISQLPMVRREENPVSWLSDEIKVAIAGESEILQISLKGQAPDQIVKLVNAVKDAFLDEIVHAENNERLKKLDILKRGYNQNLADIKQKSDTFYRLAEQLGTSDTEIARIKQKLALDDLAALKARRDVLQQQIRNVHVQFVVARTAADTATFNPSEFAIEDELDKDPLYVAQKQELLAIQDQYQLVATTLRPGSASLARFQAQLAGAQARLDNLKATLKPRAFDRLRREAGFDDDQSRQVLISHDVERQLLAQELEVARQDYEKQKNVVEQMGGVSVDLLTRADELEGQKRITNLMKAEIDGLELELQQPPRVQVVQDAVVPDDSDRMRKYFLIAGGWTILFGLTVLGVAFVDYQGKRVNSVKDVESGTGVPVVGSIPVMNRSSLLGRLPFSGLTGHSLELALQNSIDSIRTALLYNRSSDPVQVIMVASAAGQEGRTTLASQLAVSLARSGRKTLLIDADLRHPQQHVVFGMTQDVGLCELLGGRLEYDEAVQATSVEGLWLMSAGRSDEDTMQELSSGRALAAVCGESRSRFDFVVLDSGPVLTSPEPLLLGQHADTALIAIRRDVSQLPKVSAAYDRLRSVGIHVFGAVLSGEGTEIRRGDVHPPAPVQSSN